MIEKLKNINENLIKIYKDNKSELKKQLLIKKILQEEKCFFKMNITTAYSILKDLKIKDEELKNIYQELIDIQNFN